MGKQGCRAPLAVRLRQHTSARVCTTREGGAGQGPLMGQGDQGGLGRGVPWQRQQRCRPPPPSLRGGPSAWADARGAQVRRD